MSIRPEAVRNVTCLSCGERSAEWLLDIDSAPVNCSSLCPDQCSALAVTRGDIRLVCCRKCALIFNSTFNPSLVAYDPTYDNALDFSASFRAYSEALAAGLVQRYGLYRKRIVEIGSGNGRFLKQLCELGANDGLGFDPSHRSEAGPAGGGTITLIRGYFSGDFGTSQPDLICLRHVLEHLEHPADLICDLRRSLNGRKAVVYCEVPNAEAVFRGAGMWDIIYPHVSYFAEPTLRWLFERCGFETLSSGPANAGQFLFIEALAGTAASKHDADPEATQMMLSGFRTRFEQALESWAKHIVAAFNEGREIALWGCGAKAITFLNIVPGADRIPFVCDINPNKCNTYVPGTGQRITGPEMLKHSGVAEVIVLNPAYKSEIETALYRLGVRADVTTSAKASLPAVGV